MGVTSINVPKQEEGEGKKGLVVMTLELDEKDKKMFREGMAMVQLGFQLSSLTRRLRPITDAIEDDDELSLPSPSPRERNRNSDRHRSNARTILFIETNSVTYHTTNKNSRKLNKNQRRGGDTRCHQKSNNQSRQLNGSTMRSQKMKKK